MFENRLLHWSPRRHIKFFIFLSVIFDLIGFYTWILNLLLQQVSDYLILLNIITYQVMAFFLSFFLSVRPLTYMEERELSAK